MSKALPDNCSSSSHVCGIFCWIAVISITCLLTFLVWQDPVPLHPDACQYITGAVCIASGQGYLDMRGQPQIYFPPGYPLAISFFAQFAPNPAFAARLVSATASVLTVIPLVMLASELFGRRVGFAAGLVYAVLPERVATSDKILTEPLYILLLMIISLFWLRETKGFGWYRAAAMGVLLAAAYLVRPEAIVCAGALLILSLPIHRWWKVLPSRSIVICAVFLVMGMAPYIAYLHFCTGQWSISPKASMNRAVGVTISNGSSWEEAYRLNKAATEIEFSTQEPWAEMAKRSMRNLRTEVGIMGNLLGPFLTACLVLGLGIELCRGSRELNDGLPILAALSVPLAFLPLLFMQVRFVYTAIIPALIFACWQLMARFRLEQVKQLGHMRGGAAALLPLAIVTGALARYDIDIIRAQPAPSVAPALSAWVRAKVPPAAPLMDSTPEIAYCAGRRCFLLPYDSLDRTLNYARVHSIQYVLLRSGVVLSPDLVRVAAGKSVPTLDMIGEWRGRAGSWAKLYRIRRSAGPISHPPA